MKHLNYMYNVIQLSDICSINVDLDIDFGLGYSHQGHALLMCY